MANNDMPTKPVHGNTGRKRPDLAARNKSPEMRGRKRVISDEARERMSYERTKHGHARSRGEGRQGTPTYYVWAAMVQRCTNSKTKDWPDYGGRGINVCQRWLDSFELFHADMGDKPSKATLDRINTEGNYENNARRD